MLHNLLSILSKRKDEKVVTETMFSFGYDFVLCIYLDKQNNNLIF